MFIETDSGQGGKKSNNLPESADTAIRYKLTRYPVLQRVAGKDASKQFWKYHNEGILKKFKGELQVGSLDTKKTAALPTPPATPPPQEKKVKVTPTPAPAVANAKE